MSVCTPGASTQIHISVPLRSGNVLHSVPISVEKCFFGGKVGDEEFECKQLEGGANSKFQYATLEWGTVHRHGT